MGVVYTWKMDSIRVLILCFCLIAMAKASKLAKASNSKQRLTMAENKIKTLELNADLAAKNIAENARIIAEFNRTVVELKKYSFGVQDVANETEEWYKQALMNAINDENYNRMVVKELEQEQNSTREKMDRMSKAISDFETRLSNQLAVSELKLAALVVKDLRFELEHLTRSLYIETTDHSYFKAFSEEKTEALAKAEERINEALASVDEQYMAKINDALALAEERHMREIESLKKANRKELSDLEARVNKTFQNMIRDGESTKVALKPCPQSWTEYENFCYKLYDYDRVAYKEARSQCSSFNGSVVDIQDEEEMAFVNSALGGEDTWLGIQRQVPGYDSAWVWERTGNEAIYTNWSPVRFQFWSESWNCAMVQMIKGTYKWVDRPCESEQYFVCKRKTFI